MFEPSHMQYELDRENDTGGEPALADMVERGINILNKNENGYFLFVESTCVRLHINFIKSTL